MLTMPNPDDAWEKIDLVDLLDTINQAIDLLEDCDEYLLGTTDLKQLRICNAALRHHQALLHYLIRRLDKRQMRLL